MAKAENKTHETAVSVEDYIADLPTERRREEAVVLDALFRRVTGVAPRMWGPSIIGYGSYHYRYDSGREGDAPRDGFSPRKAQLVLYLVVDWGGQRAEAEALLARLGKYSQGVSCLYLNKLADVDMGVLEQLVALSHAVMGERYP